MLKDFINEVENFIVGLLEQEDLELERIKQKHHSIDEFSLLPSCGVHVQAGNFKEPNNSVMTGSCEIITKGDSDAEISRDRIVANVYSYLNEVRFISDEIEKIRAIGFDTTSLPDNDNWMYLGYVNFEIVIKN